MGLLAPLALAVLPLLGLIIALYLLKLRRPVAPVASLHLWGVLLRDREANSLWQRIHISPLLLLQLLALLALIVALARPWALSSGGVGQNLIIVVDVSASMGSKDVGTGGNKTRLGAAQDKARSLVDELPQGASATLIAADTHAAILVPPTDDKARLRGAIGDLAVRNAGTDMREAMALAGAVAAREGNTALWVLSDGAFPPVSGSGEAINAQVQFYPLGTGGVNQAITALSVEQAEGGLGVFVQLANMGSEATTRRVDFSVDEAPWTSRTVSLGPGETQSIILEDLPISARVVGAQLAGPDALAADDHAWTVNRASVPANVLLVSNGNKFLELALSLLPTVTLYKVAPAAYDPQATLAGDVPIDLTVFDAGVLTRTGQILPEGNILFVAPTLSNPLITVTGVITQPATLSPGSVAATDPGAGGATRESDPLLRFVDLSGLHIAKASRLAVPAWGRAVLGSGDAPLIVAGEREGRRVAAIAFDLHDSDLPLQPAFPLLMRNLVTYLLPLPSGGLPVSVAPGSTVPIEAAQPEVTSLLVEDPTGKETTFPVGAERPRLAFADTDAQGVYYITQYAGEEIVAQEAFTVNLFAPDESQIAPNPSPQLPASAPAQAASGANDEVFKQELWPPVALAGIGILLLEWLYAQRMAIRRAVTEVRTRRALRKAGEY